MVDAISSFFIKRLLVPLIWYGFYAFIFSSQPMLQRVGFSILCALPAAGTQLYLSRNDG